MKVSIITVCFNSENTIEKSIISVHNQTYSNIEHIIIDGGSTDKTLNIIEKYDSNIATIVSEPDNGLYHALNKGIELSNGDLIGIMHSDDVFYDEKTLSIIVETVKSKDVDAVWGDVVFIDTKDDYKIKRYYRADKISPDSFKKGIMPPHPSIYIKKIYYDKLGVYNLKYRIAADYDLALRFFLLNKLTYAYIPKIIVKMRKGGISNQSILNIIKLNMEIYKIHKANEVPLSIFDLARKIPQRLNEIISIGK